MGHINFFVNPQHPITPVIMFIGVTACLFLTEYRKFFVIWIIAAIVLFLNPLIAPPLIKYFTTPNTYWRLVYILPFPLMLGVAIGLVSNKLQSGFSKSVSLSIFFLVLFSLVILHFPKYSTSVFHTTTTLKYFPNFLYKLNPDIYNLAKKITLVAPPGPMLSPRTICGMIPLINSDYPQMRIRTRGVKHWLSKNGLIDEAIMRISASEYISGNNDILRPAFINLLKQYGSTLSCIVLKKNVYDEENNNILMRGYGFNQYMLIGDYIVVWK
jgi:hypothetical protein